MSEPVRMCAACRQHAPKKELIRIVRSPDGEVIADAREKAPGRGAYLCRRMECLAKARKSHALDRVLKIEISDEIYEALASILDGANG